MARQMLVWLAYRTTSGATKKVILPNVKPSYEYTNDELRTYIQPGDEVVDGTVSLHRRVLLDHGETNDNAPITSFARPMPSMLHIGFAALTLALLALAVYGLLT